LVSSPAPTGGATLARPAAGSRPSPAPTEGGSELPSEREESDSIATPPGANANPWRPGASPG